MTTLISRKPYTDDELIKLYPPELQLQQVQILLRHGERSPVSARFQSAGLSPYWPYCNDAKRMVNIVKVNMRGKDWDELHWRRRLETFGEDDEPVIASNARKGPDGICDLGQLTDEGRDSTLALGKRLRHLYVDRLGFMPKVINDADLMYIRSTPIPRALESVQQAFSGLYPASSRAANFPAMTIITRTVADETLFPNDGACRRFGQLSRAFAERTAERWNETDEMNYLNKLISKWMPPHSRRVAVDSHPRLSGIMDTINATLGHGPLTRLPKEFYDPKALEIINRISTEEWFSGFKESEEYRTLGIGPLLGDIVSRMTANALKSGNDGMLEVGGEDGELGEGRGGEREIKLGLSGCHDTTLAAIMASLGTFEGENTRWPNFTSHIAFELFIRRGTSSSYTDPNLKDAVRSSTAAPKVNAQQKGLWDSLVSGIFGSPSNLTERPPARKMVGEMSVDEKAQLENYFVRLRYNDKVITVPGCKSKGMHFEGNESFCTLVAFKGIVDKFTPRHWKQACRENLEKPAFPQVENQLGADVKERVIVNNK
ncbi:MAG: hypothetical protein M1824_001197 [Vezdaea acicularis]|nr:MAG: hypothetical protein M1824_001197 [Vezdaea acicularis]